MHYNVSVRDSNNLLGALAQLVARYIRIVEVRGSTPLRIAINALVAQLVEQGTENPCVGGSTPPQGTIFMRMVRHRVFVPNTSLVWLNGRAADL